MNFFGISCLHSCSYNVAIFLDISPCSPYTNQRFIQKYHLHLQGENFFRNVRNLFTAKMLLSIFQNTGFSVVQKIIYCFVIYYQCFVSHNI
jgi:hypothetical protein